MRAISIHTDLVGIVILAFLWRKISGLKDRFKTIDLWPDIRFLSSPFEIVCQCLWTSSLCPSVFILVLFFSINQRLVSNKTRNRNLFHFLSSEISSLSLRFNCFEKVITNEKKEFFYRNPYPSHNRPVINRRHFFHLDWLWNIFWGSFSKLVFKIFFNLNAIKQIYQINSKSWVPLSAHFYLLTNIFHTSSKLALFFRSIF